MITSPKEIEIKEIKPQLASLLNELWHSTHPYIHPSNIYRNPYYVCYGFFYKNVIIGIAIWTWPIAGNRFNEQNILELRRLALSELCPKNTASYVLSKMTYKIKEKFPFIKKLISYQDISKHKGTIYKAAGWKPAHNTLFKTWNTPKRKRKKDQTTGDKIRWEYII